MTFNPITWAGTTLDKAVAPLPGRAHFVPCDLADVGKLRPTTDENPPEAPDATRADS